VLLLRETGESTAGAPAPGSGASLGTRGGRVLACAACRRPVTTPQAAIAIGGQHEHTRENPHGHRFRIGCFAVAHGLVPFGAASTYWSWFPGMAWQVAHCGGCRRHLGWRFASADASFHGLILDALVAIDVDGIDEPA
jgi:hypothetical protein